MFGKLICWWNGKHKRGVRHGPITVLDGIQFITYICRCCGSTWTRKTKVRKEPI